MTPHLLPLSTLHTAAPGILDVVFGPDGDFEGAPKWTGPVWAGRDGWLAVVRFRSQEDHRGPLPPTADTRAANGSGTILGGLTLAECALDLRIPSVAARLAGLCARALGEAPGAWHVSYGGQGGWRFRSVDRVLHWTRLGTAMSGGPDLDLCDEDGEPVSLDAASFLASLTLTLAPRIAAPGGSNGLSPTHP